MKQATKKVRVKKSVVLNHLKPIDDILDCIEACEMKLIKTLDVTATKLAKLVKTAKVNLVKAKDHSAVKYKLAAYAIQKGYETDLVWTVINEMKV